MPNRSSYFPILAWAMLLVYFFGSFKVFQPYLKYNVNYDYISKVLCENKEKPKLHCNGKCFLKKELKKAVDEESGKKEVSQKGIETECLPSFQTEIIFNQYLSDLTSQFPGITLSFNSVELEHITPPPRA